MSGKVFISMADKYKADAVGIAKQLTDMGYGVVATRGTASTLMAAGEDQLAGLWWRPWYGTQLFSPVLIYTCHHIPNAQPVGNTALLLMTRS